MKAVKAGSRLHEVIQDELERIKEQKFKELREKTEQEEAKHRKSMLRAKLLKVWRSA